MASKLIPATGAAEQLGYDRSSITRMANAGIIEGQKLGEGRTSSWVFTSEAIEDAKKRLAGKKVAS